MCALSPCYLHPHLLVYLSAKVCQMTRFDTFNTSRAFVSFKLLIVHLHFYIPANRQSDQAQSIMGVETSLLFVNTTGCFL